MNYMQASITAPFNNMQTSQSKAQPTYAFFATVSQMFGGSHQLPTSAEGQVMKSLSIVQSMKLCSAVVVSWEELLNICLSIP